MKKIFLIVIIGSFLFIGILSLFNKTPKNQFNDGKLHWVSINVSLGTQGDAHLITKNGKNILIDTGLYEVAASGLIPYLKKNNIFHLDEIYVSHPHSDHYGGIRAILEDKSFIVDKIKMNMPTEAQMRKEWWGGKYTDLITIIELSKKADITISEIKKADKVIFDDKSYMEVLYVYDGINTPVGETDINDMSFISMLYDYDNKFLFTGDLNEKLGGYLANNANNIQADILKVPHHGAEGLAPNRFFDKVGSKDFIVPTPRQYWNESWDRSKRTREYVKDNNINTYINGIHGNIEIISSKDGYNILTQRDSEPFEIIPFNKLIQNKQVDIVNNTLFQNGTYDKKELENITIYGSFNSSDKDKGSILFQSKFDNEFLIKTGPVTTNQILKIYDKNQIYYEDMLPVVSGWSIIKLSKEKLPQKVFIELHDKGTTWGEWSAVGFKEK